MTMSLDARSRVAPVFTAAAPNGHKAPKGRRSSALRVRAGQLGASEIPAAPVLIPEGPWKVVRRYPHLPYSLSAQAH
jgi:hypothetical protein